MSIDGGPQYCQFTFWFVIFFKFHVTSLYCFYHVHLPFFFFKAFIYLFVIFGVLGLHCFERAFSSFGEQGPLLAVVRGLLPVTVSLVEHRLQGAWPSVAVVRGLHSCSSRALEHRLSSCDS